MTLAPDAAGKKQISQGCPIPVGYEIPRLDSPWSCPVRRCEGNFRGIKHLAGHFRSKHIRHLLHDHLDGTLTVVGARACGLRRSDRRMVSNVVSQGVELPDDTGLEDEDETSIDDLTPEPAVMQVSSYSKPLRRQTCGSKTAQSAMNSRDELTTTSPPPARVVEQKQNASGPAVARTSSASLTSATLASRADPSILFRWRSGRWRPEDRRCRLVEASRVSSTRNTISQQRFPRCGLLAVIPYTNPGDARPGLGQAV
jgi:hypothetical protein